VKSEQIHEVDAVLACRLAGTRLYGKPLQLIDMEQGITVLENLVRQLQLSASVRSIILAISDEEENRGIARLAERNGWRCVFGDPTDVLGRIVKAVDAFGVDTVIRATTECPFIYHEGLNGLIQSHFQTRSDYSMYTDLPEGAGFSVIKGEALRRSHRDGTSRHRSELITSYIFDNQDTFRINLQELPAELRRPDVRITVDYPEDLVFCRKVYRDLGGSQRLVALHEIVQYWDANAELRRPLEQIGVDWGHGRLWQ
jgi:spore coat polysaccharide biosynthesis protein SpsF